MVWAGMFGMLWDPCTEKCARRVALVIWYFFSHRTLHAEEVPYTGRRSTGSQCPKLCERPKLGAHRHCSSEAEDSGNLREFLGSCQGCVLRALEERRNSGLPLSSLKQSPAALKLETWAAKFCAGLSHNTAECYGALGLSSFHLACPLLGLRICVLRLDVLRWLSVCGRDHAFAECAARPKHSRGGENKEVTLHCSQGPAPLLAHVFTG